jgi:fructose-bisphosphate aldolase class I
VTARDIVDTAKALVADDKGLLAMDESTPTCNKRFAALGTPQSEETRRAYREMIVTTPGLGECIGGVILYDETIRQRKKDGTPFIKAIADAGIITGIKVYTGAKSMAAHPGEKITEGLDGLRERLEDYARMGARFAKGGLRSLWAPASPALDASRPMLRLWPATPRCARKPAWSPSLSRKC